MRFPVLKPNLRSIARRVILLFMFSAGLALAAQEADEDFEDYVDFGWEGELVITGTPETTQQMKVVTREDIEKHNAPDLAVLLQETLDMGITTYGAYGNQTAINIRGFDTSRIAILIDGVPANSARSGDFDITQIDLSGVERIEVIYGGSDTKYNVSGALGGVINIVTVKKQKAGLSAGGSVSNTAYLPGRYNKKGQIQNARYEDLADTQSLSAFLSYGGEKVSWKLNWSGTRAGNHYLYKDYYGFARRKDNNEVYDTNIGGNLVFDLPDSATLLTSTGLYFGRKQYPVTGYAEGFAIEKDFSLKENIAFNAPLLFGDRFSTEASLSYTLNTMKYGKLSEGMDHSGTIINRWSWYPREDLTFRAGVDWRSIFVDASEDTERMGNMGGIYLTAEYSVIKKFMLIGSVKAATDTKQAVAIPKLGFAWNVTDMFTLKNNYFRSFKFPDFDDLFYRSADGLYAGNPHLKPEDGWGADLTGELTVNRYFEASSSMYAQWTEDSIHWVKHGASWTPENVGTGCFIGFDLRPKYTLPFEKGPFKELRLGANYQYQISWLLTGNLSFDDNIRIPYMPVHIIGGSFDLRWKTGSFLLSAHYETLRYADTGNKLELLPYCLVNLNFNQDIGKNWTVFAALRNALNQLYTSFAEYPMPGASLTAGVRAKFDLGKK